MTKEIIYELYLSVKCGSNSITCYIHQHPCEYIELMFNNYSETQKGKYKTKYISSQGKKVNGTSTASFKWLY